MHVTNTFLVFLILTSTAIGQNRDYPPNFENAKTEIYKSVGDTQLKLWIFEPEDHQTEDSRPAIVFFFGGGWKAGTPAQFEQHCRYLASQGMVAMTADYRVRSRHDTLADKAVEDAESAIRWIRQNSQRLGINPNQLVAAGGSAGGHLAACLGVVSPLDHIASQKTSSVPNALALFNPAVLLAPFEDIDLGKNDDQIDKFEDIADRTGVAPERISPIHHIHSDLPPTIIFHGEADPTVPFVTVKRFTEIAVSAGNHCELDSYPTATHGFFNYGRGGQPGEYYSATVFRLHRFLQSLGYLKNPPAISTPNSKNVHLRDHLRNSEHAFAVRKKGTVAFLGGSITEMNGYRVMVQDDLQTRFPDTDFTFINAGVSSTCSTTGAFRLQEDVLAAKPDLLFAEFAVNDDQDASHAERECIRGMEGILRHARMALPDLDIVVTHFVNPPMLKLLQNKATPTSMAAHERVAERYSVSSIDLAREVAQRITKGTLDWKQYGGTHPKPPGNRIAADLIADLLDTAWTGSIPSKTAPKPHRLPRPIDQRSYFRGTMLAPETAIKEEGWKLHRPDWKNLPGSKRDRFTNSKLLCCTTVGSECQLTFNGTGIGLYVLAGPDAGTLEYSIDEGAPQSVDLYHRFSKGLHYPLTVMLDADLKQGEHTIRLRVAEQKNESSHGNAIRILKFAVNESM